MRAVVSSRTLSDAFGRAQCAVRGETPNQRHGVAKQAGDTFREDAYFPTTNATFDEAYQEEDCATDNELKYYRLQRAHRPPASACSKNPNVG